MLVTRNICSLVVRALITSRLDYCNSLLYGVTATNMAKLQRVQNAAARLITGAPKFCHIRPVLLKLHWLPIRFRINYKILLLTFKALNGLAPTYISSLITVKQLSSYSLRSNNGLLLEHKRNVKIYPTLGEKAFEIAAPKLWNALPLGLRKLESVTTFKKHIKTFIFKTALEE